MPQVCSICRHTERSAIDTAVAQRTPLRTIADRHGVSKTALLRHRQYHNFQQNMPRLPDDPELAASARCLHQEVTNALRTGGLFDVRFTLQDITALLVRLTDPTVRNG